MGEYGGIDGIGVKVNRVRVWGVFGKDEWGDIGVME